MQLHAGRIQCGNRLQPELEKPQRGSTTTNYFELGRFLFLLSPPGRRSAFLFCLPEPNCYSLLFCPLSGIYRVTATHLNPPQACLHPDKVIQCMIRHLSRLCC